MRVEERWSAEVVARAERLVEDADKVRQDFEHGEVWWVTGSAGKEYRVQTDGETWITCTCPNGMRVGRPTCYHSCAVMMITKKGRGR